MSAGIPIRRGATLALPLDFFTDSTETVAVNLTGSTFAVVNNNFPVSPTLTVSNAAGGNTVLNLPAINTATLVLNRDYYLSLQQTQPSGAIILHGPFNFYATDG